MRYIKINPNKLCSVVINNNKDDEDILRDVSSLHFRPKENKIRIVFYDGEDLTYTLCGEDAVIDLNFNTHIKKKPPSLKEIDVWSKKYK